LLGIEHKFGTIGYAAGLGVTERSHDYINNRLKIFASGKVKDWCRFLPYIAYAFNTSISASTSQSPFKTLFGFETIFPSEAHLGAHRYGLINDITNRLLKARDVAQQNLLQAQLIGEKNLTHDAET